MLCHVGDQLRVALGDIESRPRPLLFRFGNMNVQTTPGLLRFRWYRQLIVHWAPWPKARIKAPPEMLTTAPANWDDDVVALHPLIDRAGAKERADERKVTITKQTGASPLPPRIYADSEGGHAALASGIGRSLHSNGPITGAGLLSRVREAREQEGRWTFETRPGQ